MFVWNYVVKCVIYDYDNGCMLGKKYDGCRLLLENIVVWVWYC